MKGTVMGDDKDFLEDDDFFEDDDFNDDDFSDGGLDASQPTASDDMDDDGDFDFEEDGEENLSQSTSASEEKKSGKGLLYAAVGGLALVGGGVAALQMGLIGGSEPTQMAAVSQQQVAQTTVPDDLSLTAFDEPAIVSEAPVEMDAAVSSDVEEDVIALSSEEAPLEEGQAQQDLADFANSLQAPEINDVFAEADSSELANIDLPEEVSLEAELIEAPKAQEVELSALNDLPKPTFGAVSNVDVAEQTDVQMQSLTSASDKLQKNLDLVTDNMVSQGETLADVDARLRDLEQEQKAFMQMQKEFMADVASLKDDISAQSSAPMAAMASGSTVQVSKLETEVQQLERKIASLEAELKSVKVATSKVSEKPTKQLSAPKAQPVQKPAIKVVSEKKVASNTSKVTGAPTPQVGQKVVKTVSKTPVKKVSKPAPKIIKWQVVDAKPGEALLSIRGNEAVRMRVTPGYYLQDLGTITGIRMISGRWVVEATNGMIR